MTLLTIAQNAADEIGITRPSVVAASSDGNVQKLYRYANKVGNRLMKLVGWQALRKERTFTAIAGETQTGIIPSDFDRIVTETFWDRSNARLISGPITPAEWNGRKAVSYSGPDYKFIYRGGVVSISPVLAGGESLAFEYVSNKWVLAVDGTTYKTGFTVDTDTALLDEELITLGVIFEFLQGEGQPYQVAANAYEDRFKQMIENDQPDAGILVAADIFGNGRHFNGVPASASLDLTVTG